MRIFESNFSLKKIIFLKILSYLEYLFISNSIIIGLLFFLIPIMVMSNENVLFFHKFGSVMEFLLPLFSIKSPQEFINAIVALVLIAFPIIGYLASLFLKKTFKDFKFELRFAYKLLIIEIAYLLLIIISFAVFNFYGEKFDLAGFIVSVLISIFGLAFYSFSYFCRILKNELKKKTS
ncbi:MAG: hypothetical protein A2365_02130 [Candidatus Nealsonbacteria bacterium RIFOXYB1_FULL_40_15]|uniref:Uncharacterized protein n=2 Tax=Candidatus Nealsoniibacteriota TaxID=1817911 RepID=A0A1G2ETQ6_9BACT|nr:MAG: hypothetical protein A2365_02130 [Candidatus Nealsonbacteria bacterium RIFOXYB1_FULL_40_15]OGZ28658.1 MAG: hypothetical protein A2427_04585 [Candidatus Nealsonbacteria bacterium RIFOXYC1_FULL_40_7]OGZ28872.1 MAG: hypothetical protein A2562_00735 [Candidatus Nealsonbacteria bacterium RIFOXYD1_FULL_39_11]